MSTEQVPTRPTGPEKPLISQVLRQRALEAVEEMAYKPKITKGLELALQANHEYDVWQRAKHASEEFEESAPEGILPEEAEAKHNELAKQAGELIGKDAPVEMSLWGIIYKRQP